MSNVLIKKRGGRRKLLDVVDKFRTLYMVTFHGYILIFKLIKIYTLNMYRLLIRQSYFNGK